MDNAANLKKMKCKRELDSGSEEWDSDDDEETIARIQRAHYAQSAARRKPTPRQRPMSHKRKMEAVKSFHDFTKKLKQDTGIKIRSLPGKNMIGYQEFSSSSESESLSDGLSEEEFNVNPAAAEELNDENESYLDPITGDIIQNKVSIEQKPPSPTPSAENLEPPKTLTINDIIAESDLDLTKNVEIAEIEQGELCSEKSPEDLLDLKQDDGSQDFDITEKLKEMGEISVTSVKKDEPGSSESSQMVDDNKMESDDEEKKVPNSNAINVRRNIREVMDEKQLDASTLAAQRQESERLARVQEQQRIIREVQRQIAMNRQNKVHQKTLQLLQGGSLLKKGAGNQKLNLPSSVTVKLPSGEMKKTSLKHGQVEITRTTKAGPSLGPNSIRLDQKTDKKEVVEIVDSSSGEESSSSSSDSDDCIMLSDSEVPASPEVEDDPSNSGLHVNDAYNIPDEHGRVQINIGHPENEEDIFVAPQIARVIKPHQIGGVRFLFDNIIESVERFSTSTGFGCILAHSMGLGKTLQIVCFCDIFLRHTNSKTVLCIMPINTLQNWVAEFNMWLPLDGNNSSLAAHGEVRTRTFPIYVLNDSHKTLQMRAKVVKDWTTSGGVLMIGYELYRLLSMKKDKKPRKKKKSDQKQEDKDKVDDKKEPKDTNEDTQGSDNTMSKPDKDDPDKLDIDNKEAGNDEEKKLLDEMYESLVKPGPDLVICDEGHRIKNSHSNISYALKQMRTKRRVVLTGYPLQNNLLEYWCMVDFVRPNYLGSKTEFCNMFERPIQNGQCIDSTPQDIRLMRYRAHVLHSLLVGFVQRRSHAVLQSTLPQKEEYVLLVRMTPLQRKLYDRFMNEVVRSTSVPNPLKAFAICCKIWNHPDVLYNFLKKRHEVNIAIEEDLDLEEIGGVTKAGRAARGRAPTRRAAKPRTSNKKAATKKPAATIQPSTTTAKPPQNAVEPNSNYGNPPYPPYTGPPSQQYRPEQPSSGYQNQPGYYPPNQEYNQNYGNNYYPPQQPPYENYPNQYPPNPPDSSQGYNQNYWGNGNYYGNGGYYNNQQYPNNPPSHPPIEYNNQQPYPQQYPGPSDPSYQTTAVQPYPSNQNSYANQQRPPYPQNTYQNQQGFSEGYNTTTPPTGQYPNNPPQTYPNQPYQNSYTGDYNNYNQQYNANAPNYSNYPNNAQPSVAPNAPQIGPPQPVNTNVPPYSHENAKPNNNERNNLGAPPYPPAYNYNQPNTSYSDANDPNRNVNYSEPFNQYPHIDTKPLLGAAGSPLPSWPLSEALKIDSDKIKIEKIEVKTEIKSESDSEVKIEDLDTKKIFNSDNKELIKKEIKTENIVSTANDFKMDKDKAPSTDKKDDNSESGDDKKQKTKKEKKVPKKPIKRRNSKAKPKPRGRKDRKTSKDVSESEEESEKEEKLNREEELALVKKAEEVTYDWATDLLKDYVSGLIENSAKMELFFFILNESIKLGDRILLFSQSLFTLNLIEDFLEKNYIPGTNCLWQRNTSYYRLDGSTHALEREKLINEFNANSQVYLFLVSTRAGSLGINLVGANRVIVFDASWNPCHDTQAVCRVYRYGQKKPCFVYRFVMDWCLEKKIYDRQINKQGMADRVVDECNPDAVLSMKEITNLCFDNDEKESEPKDLSEHTDKYIDVVMQKIISDHGILLSKEPFQHESLLVDRKEKKLSSAEKRLAQRGYEMEKKAASAPKPTTSYRTVRTADGSIIQKPVASVRPMPNGARWIPADVWRRQGLTAQEMTLPLDVVIPTNSAEKTNIVLKAGQRVMVLKSPKGIYMQLESGKIIAIKTSFKGLPQKGGDIKDSPVGKKILGNRSTPPNLPGSLKNNSAITITSKTGVRAPMQRVMQRPGIGQIKGRPVHPGQNFRPRPITSDSRNFPIRSKPQLQQGRLIQPNLGSVSITKVPLNANKVQNVNSPKINRIHSIESDDDTQILDSEEECNTGNVAENKSSTNAEQAPKETMDNSSNNSKDTAIVDDSKAKVDDRENVSNTKQNSEQSENLTLTTEEKLPAESTLDDRIHQESQLPLQDVKHDLQEKSSKISLLKNYRHQRPTNRPPVESSLSQLEKTACSFTKESLPDFRRNLDDITQSYSPVGTDDRGTSKFKKKKSPSKPEPAADIRSTDRVPSVVMSHSVSSLLAPNTTIQKQSIRMGNEPVTPSVTPIPPMASGLQSRYSPQNPSQVSHPSTSPMLQHHSHLNTIPQGSPLVQPNKTLGHPMIPAMADNPILSKPTPITSTLPPPSAVLPPEVLPGHPVYGNPATENPYSQYPGYAMGYGGYPSSSYYGNYGAGGAAYYPPYPAAPHPYPPQPAPPPDCYPPPNPEW